MSKGLKLNVTNIASGYQNFKHLFSGQETRIYNGFPRLVKPRSLPLRRLDCKHYQQDYANRTTQNFAKVVLSEPLKKSTVTRKFSQIPLTGKWLTTAQTYPVVTPGCRFPWRTSFNLYYDVKDPKCPPADPSPCKPKTCKPSPCKSSSSKPNPCARLKKNPCPPKRNPCCPKSDPCKRKKCTFTVPMKFCRFYTKGCPPRRGGGLGGSCKPMQCSGAHKGPACGGGKKRPVCCGKKTGRKGSVCGGKKSITKGPICGPTTGKKGSVCGSKKSIKKGPICGPTTGKKGPICGGQTGGRKGPVCGGGAGGGGKKCGTCGKPMASCTGKGKCARKCGGGNKGPTCQGGRAKLPDRKCGGKGKGSCKPKKPKCCK